MNRLINRLVLEMERLVGIGFLELKPIPKETVTAGFYWTCVWKPFNNEKDVNNKFIPAGTGNSPKEAITDWEKKISVMLKTMRE